MEDSDLQEKVDVLSNCIHHTSGDLMEVMRILTELRNQHPGDNERQLFADKFVEMGGGTAITHFLIYIRSKPKMETLDSLIVAFCLNASHDSVKFCVSIGKAGLLKELADDLGKMKETYSSEHSLHVRVWGSICILYNVARSAGTKEMFKPMYIQTAIYAYGEAANDITIAAAANEVLSFICDPAPVVSGDILCYLLDNLKISTTNKRHTFPLTYCCVMVSGYAFELLLTFGRVAQNPENREFLVESGITHHVTWLMQKGDERERELAANLLWRLASDRNRLQILETDHTQETLIELQNCGSGVIEYAAKRAHLTLLNRGIREGSGTECTQRLVVTGFLQSVIASPDIDVFFEKSFDRCYCAVCLTSRGDELYYTRGKPAMDYGLPTGWFRFGLKVPPRTNASGVDAFSKWHRCFHGTRKEGIQSILETGDLLLPGDVGLGGTTLAECPGHFNDERKPREFDTKQVFLSPSIRYAGREVYAKKFSYVDEQTGKSYQAQVAFQALIRPGSYKTGVQTIGAEHQIDPHFSNQEIEWSTTERGAVILYGLLVKLNT